MEFSITGHFQIVFRFASSQNVCIRMTIKFHYVRCFYACTQFPDSIVKLMALLQRIYSEKGLKTLDDGELGFQFKKKNACYQIALN